MFVVFVLFVSKAGVVVSLDCDVCCLGGGDMYLVVCVVV